MTTCPSCGAEAPDGSRFCPSCGAALAEVAEPEEMLKLVTVLLADVVGSTARGERMHPEDTGALMTDYFAAMAEEIQAESGTVEKFAGDAVMAVTAAQQRWEDAAGLVAAARAEAEIGKQLSLPLYADRLEGRAAAAVGDVKRAAPLLRRSAEGFAALGARWEEAWSRLVLAEALNGGGRQDAEHELAAALPVFEQLGSVREAERTRALLADVASRTRRT